MFFAWIQNGAVCEELDEARSHVFVGYMNKKIVEKHLSQEKAYTLSSLLTRNHQQKCLLVESEIFEKLVPRLNSKFTSKSL